MKKVIVSVLVIGSFIFYGWHQQHEKAEVNVIAPKSSPTSVNTTSISPSGSASSTPPSTNPTTSSGYKDGDYTGSAAQNIYGAIQVKVTIAQGKISDVQFLQYPNDRHESVQINSEAMPYLKQEAIQAQSANVDVVSGATDSSQSFQESMQSALDQAKS